MTATEIESAIRFCDSYSRMPTLLSLFDPLEPDLSEWFRALGEEWSCCDNTGEFRHALQEILGLASAEPEYVELMMTQEERAALAALPDVITIYRGCYQWNVEGLSWSLARDIAAEFPFLNRYHHPDSEALLVEATASKHDCVLKLDRGEQEVICWEPKINSRHTLGVRDV